TNLSLRLLQEGKSVVAMDNHLTSSPQTLEALKENNHYRYLYHDIINPFPEELSPKNINIETIYHLACPTGVPNLTRLAEEMLLTCSLGTKQVLDLARAHHADVVFTSTSEVYGDPHVFPQTEFYTGNVSSTGIRSPYEEGKRFAEALIMMYARKYLVKAKI